MATPINEEMAISTVRSLAGQPLLLKKREGLVNEPTSACPQSQYRDYQ